MILGQLLCVSEWVSVFVLDIIFFVWQKNAFLVSRD